MWSFGVFDSSPFAQWLAECFDFVSFFSLLNWREYKLPSFCACSTPCISQQCECSSEDGFTGSYQICSAHQISMELKESPFHFHTLFKTCHIAMYGIWIDAFKFTMDLIPIWDQTRESDFIFGPKNVGSSCWSVFSEGFIYLQNGTLPKTTGDTFVKAKGVPRGCGSCKNKNLVNQMCQSRTMAKETWNSLRWWRQNSNHLKSTVYRELTEVKW